jgi:hypothetical protein
MSFPLFTSIKPATDGIEALRLVHPWPDISALQNDPPHVWSLDGGGRKIISELIQRVRPQTILEVGSFLGGSALTWLSAGPRFTLIALDSWHQHAANWIDVVIANPPSWVSDVEALKPISQAIHRTDLMTVALHNLRRYRDRVIPIRMTAVEGYPYIAGLVQPDIVYIDADKQAENYYLAHKLFPNAIICGDDWTWRDEAGELPVRRYVNEIAALRGCSIVAEDATWMLQ